VLPLWEETRAAPCWTQLVPSISATDPLHYKAEPTSHLCCLWENVLKKGQKTLDRERRRGKKGEQRKQHQGQRRRSRYSRHWRQDFLAAHRELMPEQMNITEGTATCGEPMMEWRKRMSGKTHQREKVLCTVKPHPPAPLKGLSRGAKTEGVTLNLRKEGENVLV